MKKKILAGLAALVVIAGFSAFAATPAASDGSSSGTYGPGYTCYDNGNGFCRGPRACYDDQDYCYTGNIARDRAAAAGLMASAVVRAVRIALPIALNSKPF